MDFRTGPAPLVGALVATSRLRPSLPSRPSSAFLTFLAFPAFLAFLTFPAFPALPHLLVAAAQEDPLEFVDRLARVDGEALQVRHLVGAPGEAEVQAAGVAHHRDVERLAVRTSAEIG